jgi:transcriptional regulator with XRE-family HTH domain
MTSDEHQDAGDVFAAGVGRKVKAAREAAGLSQSTLERNAGLRPCTVSELERGESDLPVYDLLRIADAVGVDVRDLLPGGTP